MKFNDVIFPHPVLGIGDSIFGKAGFIKDPDIVISKDDYKIYIECYLDNEDLISLLTES